MIDPPFRRGSLQGKKLKFKSFSASRLALGAADISADMTVEKGLGKLYVFRDIGEIGSQPDRGAECSRSLGFGQFQKLFQRQSVFVLKATRQIAPGKSKGTSHAPGLQ